MKYLPTCSKRRHSQYHLLSTNYSIFPCQLATFLQTGRPLTSPLSSNLGLKAQSLIIDPFPYYPYPLSCLNALFTTGSNTISSQTPSSLPDSLDSDLAAQSTHDWQRNLNHGLSSAALILDMSKAFDKVPHHYLLHSLSTVGVSGPLFKWFESYLSYRSQKVVLNGYTSTSLPVHSGGPFWDPCYLSFTLTP